MPRFLLLLIIFNLFGLQVIAQSRIHSTQYDNVLKYREFADDGTRALDDRQFYAERAVALSKEIDIDSVILRSNRILSTVYLYKGNYDSFAKINYTNLELAKSLKDSLSIAIANHNLGFYQTVNLQNDSAYYYYTTATKIYDQIGDNSRNIDLLPNLAALQYSERDYFGAEGNAIKGLKLLADAPKTQSNYDSAWILNNLMGMISLSLKQYDKSIDYHSRAQTIARELKDDVLTQLFSVNNIAFVYRKKGDFETSLKLYESVLLEHNLLEIDPIFYALIIDNIAFTKFLNGNENYEELEQTFKEAYKISDSLNDPITKLGVIIDLSKFYKKQNKLEPSLVYAQQAYELAKRLSVNDILLESMLVLSELKSGEEGKSYLREHIKLNDSLLSHERGIRNKFARVQFETDQIELENERILTEKMWWTISSAVLLITSLLVYIIITQRNRNKELKLKQDQQEVNEEIYNLMLSQQDKVDGARDDEKKRISQELHDGVLSRLFGTRLSLDSYNLKEGNEAIQVRSKYICELQTIENDIRKISHDLNTDFVSGSGFMDILMELIDHQSEMHQIAYDFDYTEAIQWESVSNKTKINMYRMVQESLQNIYKHASAKRIKISIDLKKDVIWVVINDDGIGFDPSKIKKGIGLKNIYARVKELNGTVSFHTQINHGTTIELKIPYTS